MQKILEKINIILKDTTHNFVITSPLAEGADRLVVDEVLNWKGFGKFGMHKNQRQNPIQLIKNTVFYGTKPRIVQIIKTPFQKFLFLKYNNCFRWWILFLQDNYHTHH